MTLKNFFLDIFLGIKKYNFWMTYGINDIKTKYRRTKLGQWWITLSVALFLFIIGGFFKGAFYADFDIYLAYLSVGYISWLFMQDCVNGGCNILIQSKSFLLQKSWPISIFIFRFIYREIIILLHHAVLLTGPAGFQSSLRQLLHGKRNTFHFDQILLMKVFVPPDRDPSPPRPDHFLDRLLRPPTIQFPPQVPDTGISSLL